MHRLSKSWKMRKTIKEKLNFDFSFHSVLAPQKNLLNRLNGVTYPLTKTPVEKHQFAFKTSKRKVHFNQLTLHVKIFYL